MNPRIFIIRLILIVFTCVICQLNYAQEIHWSIKHKLCWNDFRINDTIFTNGSIAALTTSNIAISFQIVQDSIIISVENVFITEKSWYKNKCNNASLLAHEQLHFDITEVYARSLRKKISRLLPDSIRKMEESANILYQNVVKLIETEQNKYDTETNYSLNIVQQSKWQKRVEENLGLLRDYESEVVKLKYINTGNNPKIKQNNDEEMQKYKEVINKYINDSSKLKLNDSIK